MALRKIGQTWYVYFRDLDGKIKTRSLKVHDEATAKALHDSYMEQIRAKKGRAVLLRDFPEVAAVIPKSVAPEPSGPVHTRGTIRISDMWECALTKRKLSKTHANIWRTFVSRAQVNFADQVTPEFALEYLETYYGQGNGKSYNNVKSILNTVFRCCLVEAGLSASPFQPIINKLITEVDTHRNLTLEEFDRLCEMAPLPIKILLMLSRWTTQRWETCYRMTPEMFDFEKRVFIIDPGKTRRFKKWVCCPIMPELEEFLRPILPKCQKGKSIVSNFSDWIPNTFNKKQKELFIAAGVLDNESGKASFHSIRGTAITWFKDHGVIGDDLRSITGHTSDAMEDIYARPMANISQIAKDFKEGRRQ
ncbi:MAG: site-specific integrase [Lentisphaeria bacterium]|nr:site-specific integrase [Lentisphaeria bacterium]